MERIYRSSNMLHVTRTRRSKTSINKSGVRKKREIKEKFGIKIPRNIKEALLFDKENQNNKWMDAVLKEMTALKKLKCFKFHPSNTKFSKSNGWQYCPLHMIFDIKQQDMRHKARLVAGGNVIDSSSYNTKSTTVVEDVISELCKVIGIESENEQEEFSLYCIVEGETFNVPLTKDHYILDVTTGSCM